MHKKIGVLALQGDFLEHKQALRRLGIEAQEVRSPNQLDDLGGLIIPGGESTTIAKLMDLYDIREHLKERITDGMAVWGTCAGAILLAKRAPDLGCEGLRLMDIAIERNAFGRQVNSFEADVSVQALGAEPYHGVFIRAPVFSEVGAKATTLASLANGAVVAAQEEKLLATAFHPELTADTRFHRYFLRLATNGRSPVQHGEMGPSAQRTASPS